MCGTATVADDSGCNALARDCAAFDAVVCTADSDQPAATCPARCSGDGECQGGYGCAGGACVAIVGLGQSCTGTGRGSCAEGLKCENAVCCGASASTCCSPAKGGVECAGALACNSVTFSCFTTCNDLDTSRCASAADYCQGNACHPKLADGAVCSQPGQCVNGACECFDPTCSDRRCRRGWCGVCQSAQNNDSCGIALGSSSVPTPDPTPGECEGDVACYAGSCKKKDGVSCGANSQCGNVCIAGQCAPVSGGGGPCDTGEGASGNPDCASGFVCEGGTCKAPEGASCSYPTVPCLGGLLCVSTNGGPYQCCAPPCGAY
jgi:hypothetical protein